MLTSSNINSVVDQSIDGSKFLHQVLLNSGGSGWSPNDQTVKQNSKDVESYWVQIELTKVTKIFSIRIQQDWKKGKGKYWVKFGVNKSSLQTYSTSTNEIKVSSSQPLKYKQIYELNVFSFKNQSKTNSCLGNQASNENCV